MAENQQPDPKKTETNSVDLSELENLSFGPDWTSKSASGGGGSGGHAPAESRERGRGKPGDGGGAARRDRRPPRSAGGGAPDRGDRRERGEGAPMGGDRDRRGGGGGRGQGQGRPRGDSRDQRSAPPFRPTVEVLFYPEDEPFKKLVKVMRTSCRTFELFEIARLLLEKPDRFVAVIRPPRGEGQLYLSVPDQLPFETEEEAIGHVVANHLDQWFEVEEVEVEPPKGNFQFVNRCTITGVLLGPPNYHRYQEFLQHHHATRLPNLSFERFQSKIETVRDEEVVQQWLSEMTKATRFTLKEGIGKPEGRRTFESRDAARRYLLLEHRAEVVQPAETGRVPGSAIEKLPQGGNIRRSIEASIEDQRRFPLDSANHLRSRLRRMRFAIYKRGSKGVSYVCAVKRRFRDPEMHFAESVDSLLRFLDAHPNIRANELPEKFLGIKLEPAPETPKPEADQPKAEATEAQAEPVAAPTEETKPEDAESATTEQPKPEAAAEESQPEVAAGETKPEAETSEPETASEAPTPEPEAESTPEAVEAPQPKPAAESTPPPIDPRLIALKRDLHWLVSEGYVSEYQDGRLFAQPVMEQSRKPEPAKAKEGEAKQEEAKETSAQPEAVEENEAPEVAPVPAPEPTAPVQPESKPAGKAAAEAAPSEPAPAPEAEPPQEKNEVATPSPEAFSEPNQPTEPEPAPEPASAPQPEEPAAEAPSEPSAETPSEEAPKADKA